MTTFQAGSIEPNPDQPTFQQHISDVVYRLRPGKLNSAAYEQLQHDMSLAISVLRELFNGTPRGPKIGHFIGLIEAAFQSKPATLEEIAPLFTHPKPTAGVLPARDRSALLAVVLDALDGTEVARPNNAPTLTLVKRIGLKDGRHQAFWCVVSKGSA